MRKIEEAKSNLIDTLASINKDNLNLYELKTYVEILKLISEIQPESYFDKMCEMFKDGFNKSTNITAMQYPKIAEMKGE